jgi:putative NADPH-quinone reductase
MATPQAPKRILLIDGHPDSLAERYLHALSRAYFDGARSRGHEVRSIIVSELQFPLLRSGDDFRTGAPPPAIRACQQDLAWADHVVILFPLWLGSMPALLKGFFEQVLRPGFAFAPATNGAVPKKLLAGKSARIIVTMGMPALFYRWYFRAHSLKSLERNILGFCGIGPVRSCVFGRVEASAQRRGNWLARVQKLGESVG